MALLQFVLDTRDSRLFRGLQDKDQPGEVPRREINKKGASGCARPGIATSGKEKELKNCKWWKAPKAKLEKTQKVA